MTGAGVVVVLTAVVVVVVVVIAPLGLAAVGVAAELGFVALAVDVADAAFTSFSRKEKKLNVILPQNTLNQSSFRDVHLVKYYVTFIGATGDVADVFAVVDVAIGAGVGVVLAAVVVVVGALGLASVAVAD